MPLDAYLIELYWGMLKNWFKWSVILQSLLVDVKHIIKTTQCPISRNANDINSPQSLGSSCTNMRKQTFKNSPHIIKIRVAIE